MEFGLSSMMMMMMMITMLMMIEFRMVTLFEFGVDTRSSIKLYRGLNLRSNI